MFKKFSFLKFIIVLLIVAIIIFIIYRLIQRPTINYIKEVERNTNELSAYQLTEELNMYYEGQNFNYGNFIKTHSLIISNPLTIKTTVESNLNKNLNKMLYYFEEDSKIYQYQQRENSNAYSREEVLESDLLLTSELNLYKNNMKKVDCLNKASGIRSTCYSNTFRIKDLPITSREDFYRLLKTVTGTNDISYLTRIEMTQHIAISDTRKIITNIEYDLSKIIQEYLTRTNQVEGELFKYKLTYAMTIFKNSSFMIEKSKIQILANDEAPNQLLSEDIDTLPINITKDGYINYDGDIDIYRLNIPKQMNIYFSFEADVPINVTLHASNGEEIYLMNRFFSNQNTRYFKELLEPGEYYVKINSNGEIGKYSFGTENNKPDDNRDDFTDESLPLFSISSSSIINGTINYLGDIDLFSLNIQENERAIYQVSTPEYTDMYLITRYHHTDKYSSRLLLKDEVFTLSNQTDYSFYLMIKSNEHIGNYRLDVKVFNSTNDVPNDFHDESIPEIDITDSFDITFHQSNDTDIYQVNVIQKGIYQFIFNSHLTVEVYDDNKNYVTTLREDNDGHSNNYAHEFNEGTYYFNFKSGSNIIHYQARLVEDDYKHVTTISVDDVIEPIDMTINYTNDQDQFKLLINEPQYLDFNITKINEFSYYKLIITNQNNIEVCNYNCNGYYFYPGEYLVTFSGTINSSINLKLTQNNLIEDDYADDHLLHPNHVGILQIGNNTIHFNFSSDMDVYQVQITQPGDYNIRLVDGIKVYHYKEGKLERIYDTQIYLEDGVHYFYFLNLSTQVQDFPIIRNIN